MYKITDSQDLKLKRKDQWVRHWNFYTAANYYRSLSVWPGLL